MTQAEAEAIAAHALAVMAADDDLAGAFLAAAGIAPEGLRRAAAAPGFLGQVLDFMTETDDRAMSVAAAAGIAPARVGTARTRLAGPGGPDWPA